MGSVLNTTARLTATKDFNRQLMKTIVHVLVAVAGIVTFPLAAVSQVIAPDTSSAAAAVQVAAKQYTAAIGNNSLLFTGPEYQDYNQPYMQGNQFFGAGKPQPGTVHYYETIYTKAPLQYDLKEDQLVIQPSFNPLQFKLVDEHVKYFVLAGHTFVRLVKNDTARYSLPTGYYDLVVDGPAQMLAKRTKKTQTRRGLYGLEGSYSEEAAFYLQKDNAFHAVSSRKSILRLLSDKKTNLESYARERRLKFKKATQEAAITELVRHYNSLQNQLTQANY